MRISAISYATMLHIGLLVVMIFGVPFFNTRDFDIPEPIELDIVTVEEVSRTPERKQPIPDPPKKKPPAVKKPEKPKPAPKSVEEKPKPAPPSPPEKVEPPELTEDVAPVRDPIPVKKPPRKPKVVKKKKPPAEELPDFASVLKNLAETDTKPEPRIDERADVTSGQKPQIAPLGDRLSMSELDALRRQLASCWNAPIGARDAHKMFVEVYMVINPDRTLRHARVVDQRRYNADSFFRAMADSAMRAVQNPRCSPLRLPVDKYDQWSTMVVTFDPRDMF